MRAPFLSILTFILVGCGDSSLTEDSSRTGLSIDPIADAEEREIFHQTEINLSTPLTYGRVSVYHFMSGIVQKLEEITFDAPDPSLHLGFSSPVSTPSSAVLLHVVTHGISAAISQEFVCFAPINHASSRHTHNVTCSMASTIPYYLAATRVGRSGDHPFHDIQDRYPLWRSIVEASDNDLTGFYVSIFGTLQNAFVGMGSRLFDHDRFSVRPVMETVVGQFIEHYQRHGSISARQLMSIANDITDHSLPLDRLARFQGTYDQYAHVSDVELRNTGGSLTRRNQQLELLNMSNELSRFYLRDSPFEMSDYRTHIVQNVQHRSLNNQLSVTWDPIGHMYGYNIYFNDRHIGYTRIPGITLPADSQGSVTIKAVGYAGEFDGVHHELSDPTLIAGAE